MITITGSNYIAGKESRQGTASYNSVNPIKNEQSPISFLCATEKEITNAGEQAFVGFEKMEQVLSKDIASFLNNVSKQIANLGDQLIDSCSWETALPKNRLMNERNRTCNQIELIASYIQRGEHVEAVIDTAKHKPDIRRMLIAVGPVLVFPASNFPFAFGVCGGDTISAIAAGCPVVIKTHPSHPQTAELFAHAMNKAIDQSNVPKELFSLIHTNKGEDIQQLIMHPAFQAIGFTGSHYVGRRIFDIACARKRPIPVFAEMGSINPIFVTQQAIDERMSQISSLLADSITLGVGQFCTKPGIICIPKDNGRFVSLLCEKIKMKKNGVLLNSHIAKGYQKSVQMMRETKNVSILIHNEGLGENEGDSTLFLTDTDTFVNEPRLQNEHFGPTAIIVTYRKKDDLFQIFSSLEGQLTGTIHCSNSEMIELKSFLDQMKHKVGRLIINGIPTGVEVCYAMQHGGPYPATTAPWSTSVGVFSVKRFLRPVAFQDVPDGVLPRYLQNKNHDKILRLINGKYTRRDIG